ncbi:MAG: sugar nucleotide-binding protein [Lachnospiraceae bacterium]|nr:sugar nucleotide-binding protein [Lachnospiraceae bacterium]
MKRILILGASGTVGSAALKLLSQEKDLEILGTYFSTLQKEASSMIHFSVEFPNDIYSILEQARPDIVISCLRGDFDKQLAVHRGIADYLAPGDGKIIYVSTANVFDGSCEKPHYETDTPISASAYGQFKIECENLLRDRMGDRAIVLRIPFVWGKNSPRIQTVKAGCGSGRLEIYTDFYSNHVSDLQIAEMIHWIIREDKNGIFHVGTSDVINYQQFMERLITATGMKKPELTFLKEPGIMAVLSNRDDIPEQLKWNSGRLIQYLAAVL